MNQLYTALLNDGPQTMEELPGNYTSVPVYLRAEGVRKFTIDIGLAIHSPVVYYIEGKHDPETVVEAWHDRNAHLIDKANSQSLHMRLCKLGEPWKSIGMDAFGLELTELYDYHSPNHVDEAGDDGHNVTQLPLAVACVLADPDTDLTHDEAVAVVKPNDALELCKRGCGSAVYPRNFANHIATECDAVDRDPSDPDSGEVRAR